MTATEVLQFRPGIRDVEGYVEPWEAATNKAIRAAVDAANHKVNGAVFEPFQIKVVQGTDFANIWNSERGSNPITFFQFFGTGQFLPLGDLVMPGSSNAQSIPTYPDAVTLFAPAPGHGDALAHPAGVEWILDDFRSGNSRDIKYWRLIPPAGYSALGIAFTNGAQPDVSRYWCVNNQYLQEISREFYWSDDGQHWTKHTGDLWKPVFDGAAPAAPDGQMLVIPPVFLSFEDRGNEKAFAIVMDTANLAVADTKPPDPVFTRDTVDGMVTEYGLKAVKIVPYMAIADPGYQFQALSSPFYYVAAEPFWQCARVAPTPDGGTSEMSIRIGVSETQSKSFREKTSMTVSAEVGAGFDGLGAKASASFTKEFELTTMNSTTRSTEVESKETLNYPKQPVTSVWEHRTQISVYRTNMSQLPSATYTNRSTKFAPDPHTA